MSTAASSKVLPTTFLSLSNSTFSLTTLVLTIVALALVHRLITTILLSPLRHIPGPPLAALTSFYLLFIDFSGARTSTIHDWHLRYGPTIRIGPTELSYADIDPINTIYAQGGPFGKSPSYDQYALPPAGIFAMRDREDHKRRRKLLAPAFAMSSLYEVEPLIMLHMRRLVEYLQRKTKGSVDALLAFRMLSLDVTSELFLGKSFDVLSKVDEQGDLVVPGYVRDVEAFFICTSLQWQFPWVLKLVGMLPFQKLQHWLASGERVCQVGVKAMASRSEVDLQDTKRKNMMTNMIDASRADESSAHRMTDFQIGRELSNMLLAGTDTTSTSLTYLFWELAKQPSWQTRIVSELNATKIVLGISNFTALTFRQLSELPVLDAVVTEALRLHPAAPASLPRVCADGDAIIGGTVVPSGTIVSAQCYTTHRAPHAFPRPDAFLPERWLEPSIVTSEMKDLYMPFGKGSRACLGRTMGIMELKLVVAMVLIRFTVVVPKEAEAQDMTMEDHFLAQPRGKSCVLAFRERASL